MKNNVLRERKRLERKKNATVLVSNKQWVLKKEKETNGTEVYVAIGRWMLREMGLGQKKWGNAKAIPNFMWVVQEKWKNPPGQKT